MGEAERDTLGETPRPHRDLRHGYPKIPAVYPIDTGWDPA